MGEVLILIIIALVWGFKAAVANEGKKVNDRETGSISASPDELIKKPSARLKIWMRCAGRRKKAPEPDGDQSAPQAAPRRRVGEKRAAPRRRARAQRKALGDRA